MNKKNKRKGFDDLLARRSELGDVSPPWETPIEPAVPLPPAPASPDAVPVPYASQDEGELDARERADLATCEAAIDNLRVAFWAAGKALQTIRDARLYRESHGTFEDYVTDRWDMQTSQAYRLIQAWPLAEILSPIGDKINEAQVRELLPLANRHGQNAAVTVYQTIAEAEEVKVTAAVLKGAIQVLPDDRFDPPEAAEQIRAYLQGEIQPSSPQLTPVEAFAAEVNRIRTILRRTIDRDTVRAAAVENPDEVRKFVTELRHLADEMEKGADT